MEKKHLEIFFTLYIENGVEDVKFGYEGNKDQLATAFYKVLHYDPGFRNIIISSVVAYTEDLNNPENHH